MPLHRDEPRPFDRLDRLRETVVAAGADDETVADPVDALMMVAAHRQVAGADDVRQSCAVFDRRRVRREHAAAELIAARAQRLRQMLVQCATRGDVRQLQTPADAENGHPATTCAGQQRQLPRITIGAGLVGLGVGRGAVESGIDVEAAGEDQPVQTVEHRVGGSIRVGLRWQQHPRAADRGGRVEVDLGQKGRAHVPHTLLGALEVGREADDGS